MTVSAPAAPAPLKPATIVPVWVLTLVAAVLVGVLSPADDFYVWLPLVLAGSIVLTFVLQLVLSEKEGLVTRTMLSTCGSLVILAVATAVLAIVH